MNLVNLQKKIKNYIDIKKNKMPPPPPQKKHLPKLKANKKYYQVKLNENKKCCEANR